MLAACQGCRVTSADLGFGFGHPAHGKRVAEQLFRDGADIVCHVAGQSGLGVLQAAAKPGRLAIGVDTDQDGVVPAHVLVSVVQRGPPGHPLRSAGRLRRAQRPRVPGVRRAGPTDLTGGQPSGSRWASSGAKAGKQTATYSAPSAPTR